MINLLDIHVEPSHRHGDRVRPGRDVDVQPHYFGGLVDRVDLVIDHHPEQPGYTTVFKDIRTITIHLHHPDRAPARGRRQHLGADGDGDALRHQVRHAVLQPQTNRSI